MKIWKNVVAILVGILVLISQMASAIETTQIDQMVTIYPLNSEYLNSTYNFSDPANSTMTNYYQTILPWMNETGIEGSVTCGLIPSIVFQVSDNETFTDSKFMGLIKFPSERIMSGSSQSYWRCPLLNISGYSKLELYIWHIDSPDVLEIISDEPNEISHPYLAYCQTYYQLHDNRTNWFQNITAWDFDFQFSWVLVDAFIHSDEWYFYKWVISHTDNDLGQNVVMSQCDIGDDDIAISWFKDSVMNVIPADFDIAVIHEYGFGDAVSGYEMETEDEQNIIFYSELSSPVDSQFDTITFFMPFIRDITITNNLRVNLQNINASFSSSYWVATLTEPKIDFTLHTFQWGKNYENTKFRITLTFQNESNSIFVYDSNSEFDMDFDDETAYRTNRFLITGHPVLPDNDFYIFHRVYHALQAGDGYWTNTNIDPAYYLDGHLVNRSDLQLKGKTEYPFYIKLIFGAMMLPYYIYNFADKFIFSDILPDINKTRYIGYIAEHLGDLIDWYENHPLTKFINAASGFFKDAIQFIVKWGSYLLNAILKGLALIIFVPIWMFCVLIVNGVKRFFVLMATNGPVDAADYAENFFKNSISVAKALPITRMVQTIRGR